MTVTLDDLVDALRSAGLRITAPRRAVCRVLVEHPDAHLSAGDIAERVAGHGIDPSTVYRALDLLLGLGLVTHVHLGHGPGVYHLARHPGHHHLVCEECGRVIDVPMGEIQEAVDALTAPHGFAADTSHFAITGRCAACRASGE